MPATIMPAIQWFAQIFSLSKIGDANGWEILLTHHRKTYKV